MFLFEGDYGLCKLRCRSICLSIARQTVRGGFASPAAVYALHVFYPDDSGPRHIEHLFDAKEVLTRVSALLEEHEGCERIVVFQTATRLFSVDCHGNSTPG